MTKLEGEHQRYKNALLDIAAESTDGAAVATARAAIYPAIFRKKTSEPEFGPSEGLNGRMPKFL